MTVFPFFILFSLLGISGYIINSQSVDLLFVYGISSVWQLFLFCSSIFLKEIMFSCCRKWILIKLECLWINGRKIRNTWTATAIVLHSIRTLSAWGSCLYVIGVFSVSVLISPEFFSNSSRDSTIGSRTFLRSGLSYGCYCVSSLSSFIFYLALSWRLSYFLWVILSFLFHISLISLGFVLSLTLLFL